MCRLLKVHRSGFYHWLRYGPSLRDREDQRLLGLIRKSWLESGAVYGSPRIHRDLREWGETCGRHRVARLMKTHQLKALIGYKRFKRQYRQPISTTPNQVQQMFTTKQPNLCWVSDITYIQTREGWLFLAVVIDLYSRQIIGWSMSAKINTDLVLHALMMALWRRQPKQEVIVHSDQGTQYTSDACQRFMKHHQLISSMSRRGNCYDNAVAESFFHSLKTEQIKRRIYQTRTAARQDIFEYIEIFYNQKRRHSFNKLLSPVQFERTFSTR